MNGWARWLSWLTNPWVVLASIALGVLLGVYCQETARDMAVVGDIYLSLLKMCVVPVMVTALVSSLARMLQCPGVSRLMSRILIVMAVAVTLSAALGVLTGEIMRPGENLDKESQQVLGRFLSDSGSVVVSADMVISGQAAKTAESGVLLQLLRVAPTNIFAALNRGDTMQILIFSLILGVAVAMIPGRRSERLVADVDVIFQSFVLLIGWLMYLLPICLPFLLANQVQSLGGELIKGMFKFILAIHVAALAMIALNTLIIRLASGKSVANVLRETREPLLVGMVTLNSFAAMPSAIRSLHEDLGFESASVNLLLPIGITMFRFGSVMAFALSAVFFAQLYNVSLGFGDCLMITIFSVLAGLASAGTPGLVSATLIAMVLEPLGLPCEAAIVLLVAVDPIYDPILTLVNVQTNMATTALVARRGLGSCETGAGGREAMDVLTERGEPA